jgi:hypothetical protein
MKLSKKEKMVILEALQGNSIDLLETQNEILEDALEVNGTQENLARLNLEALMQKKGLVDNLVNKFLLSLCEETQSEIMYIIDLDL